MEKETGLDGHQGHGRPKSPCPFVYQTESPAQQVAHHEQSECKDCGTYITVVKELCEEVARHAGSPTWFPEISDEIVTGEQEQLVLLLVEEMVGIEQLEEYPTCHAPQHDEAYLSYSWFDDTHDVSLTVSI